MFVATLVYTIPASVVTCGHLLCAGAHCWASTWACNICYWFWQNRDTGDLHVINSELFSYREARLALSVTASWSQQHCPLSLLGALHNHSTDTVQIPRLSTRGSTFYLHLFGDKYYWLMLVVLNWAFNYR